MNKLQLRFLILLPAITALIGFLYDYLLPSSIILDIQDYIDGKDVKYDINIILLLLQSLISITSFAGLLYFKSWARHLYVFSIVLSFTLYPFIGITIVSSISRIFYDLSWVSSGILITVLYSNQWGHINGVRAL